MFAKAAQSGPTETSAICPLSGKSDIAERSSSGRDYEYTPEPPRCAVAVSGRGYRSRRLEGRSRKVKVALVLNQLATVTFLTVMVSLGLAAICPAELAAPNSGDSFALSSKSLSDG